MSNRPDSVQDPFVSNQVGSHALGAGHRATATESVSADAVIPLAEETARIDKRVVEKGRVRVHTHTEVNEQVLRETLRSDAVGVTRVPIDRIIQEGEPAPQVRTEAGVTIIPVLEEVLVVEKRLVLKEEVHIRQTTRGEDVEVPVTLHKQHATIERIRPDGTITSEPTTEE
ncbi:YsnF/AvaK domain-containing protein [Methylobacterium oryzisoli]|uniref:YsnF/AvaK domain-containing protein n=1 Tax=Methylobacterium oryzisoli TaxID=3385502 RepID=UPI0038915DD4